MKWFVAVFCILALLACGKKQEAKQAHPDDRASGEQAHPDRHIEEANVVELTSRRRRNLGLGFCTRIILQLPLVVNRLISQCSGQVKSS